MHGAEATCRERLGVGEGCGRAPILAEHTLGPPAESTAYPPPAQPPGAGSREPGAVKPGTSRSPLPAPRSLYGPPLPAPRSALPLVPLPNGREVNHSSPIGGWLTSAGVILITMKLLRTCYRPRPSGPP